MKYLLLIPITVGMTGSVMCWVAAARFEWPSRWITARWMLAGASLQVTSLIMAGMLDA